MARQLLTILCPVFNEEFVVPLFFDRIKPVVEQLSLEYDVNLVFIDNASSDGTIDAINRIRSNYHFVYLIALAKNVGYQCSLECGLRNSVGDIFVFIDVDCEDPPEMIIDFVAQHKQGFDIVYGERVDRHEPEILKNARKVFYRFTRLIADEEIVLDMAEFSLLTAEVRNAIIEDNTSFPFIRASIGRVGFKRIGIPYTRHKRIAGETHYNLLGMTKFAITGILSSTTLPLRIPIYLFPLWVAAIAVITIAMGVQSGQWLLPMLCLITFSYFGFILSFIAIYVARVHKNTLGRPNSFIRTEYSALQRNALNPSSAKRAQLRAVSS